MSTLRLLFAAMLLLATLAGGWGAAQDPAPKQAGADSGAAIPQLTKADVTAGQAELAAAAELTEEQRAKATADWAEAQRLLEEEAAVRSDLATFEQDAAAGPARLEELKAQLAQAPPAPKVEVPEGAALKDVEQLREQAAQEAEAARQDVEALKAEADRRAARLAALPSELSQARDALQKAREAFTAPAPENEPAALRVARSARVRARIQATGARNAKLQAEQRSYQTRTEVLQLRRDLARRDAEQKEKLASSWEATASEFRRRAASETQDEAHLLLQRAQAYPALSLVAEENRAYSLELADPESPEEGLLLRIDEVTARRDERRTQLEALTQRFETAWRRYRVAGGTFSMGELLRRENETLPDERDLRKRSKKRRAELIEAELRKFDLMSARDEIYDVGVRVRQFVEGQPEDMPAAEKAQLEADARALFSAELELVDKLRDSYRIYAGRLEELDTATLALLEETTRFREFIAERILWVRSVEKGRLFEPGTALHALLWMFGVDQDGKSPAKVRQLLTGYWGAFVGVALGLLAALWLRRRAIARMAALAPRIVSYRTDSIRWTFEALGLTAVIALPTPLVLFSLAWIFSAIEDPSDWERAWAAGFEDIDWLAGGIFYFMAATRAGGLCETHFRWPRGATAALRHDLRWLVPIAVAMHFIIWGLDSHGDADWNNSLGRGAFVFTMLVLAVFTARCLLPGRPVLATFLERNPSSPIARLRYLWPTLGVGFPLGNALIAGLGYYYSALNLNKAVGDTLVFSALTVLAFNLGLRWLFVARRRMTVEQALRRREKAQAESQKEGAPQELALVVEDQVDIPAVDAQTRSLLRASVVLALLLGLPKIWGGLIPSLQYFERVQLWPRIELLESADVEQFAERYAPSTKEVTTGKGEASTESAGVKMTSPMSLVSAPADDGESTGVMAYSMTLADLGLALVLATLTVLAMLNIPGLLEITLLKRLPVDAGSRYAITTIARYLIAIVGATASFGAIHIGWDTVKWLAAALTFGLAFGLQEIFANFISGLIILLERPVRVGDTVTVGTVEGVVSRIRMRATTVVDWDNREFLVPNKNLITGEVTNWTLSDSITRLVFQIGVAYGSDTRRARELLLRAATDCPHVMKEPGPNVLFRMFGPSALEFHLRTYIPTRSVWLDTINQVNTRIDDLFREAGIEIAYNQLDVHIRDGELPRPAGVED